MRTWLARSGIGVFCAIALLWAFVAWPWLSGSVTIPYDAKAHFQAQLQFLANALHRGDSPFWTPNVFGGSPQIADPQSLIFSPAILLALVDSKPSFRAMDAYVLGLLLLGALSVAQFGRERGWPAVAQIVAALVFAFGASASWRLQHVGQVQSLACFAIAFWLLARALRNGRWSSGLAAGVAAGVMVVTPGQIAYLGVLLLAGYVCWFVAAQPSLHETARRIWPGLLSGALAGAVIVIGPLLMTWLFSQISSRPEIDLAEAGRGSLHPAFLLTAFIADLFGAADPKVDFWGPSSSTWQPGVLTLSQNMGQVYVGALPLLAVILWLSQGWREVGSEARFLLGALAGMIIYAVGWYTPVFDLLFHWLPGVSLFRRPADATFMIGALMAPLAGYALAGLMARAEAKAINLRRMVGAFAGVVAMFGIGLLVAFHHGKLGVATSPLASAALWFMLAGVLIALVMKAQAKQVGVAATALASIAVATDFRMNNGPNESTALPPAHYAELAPDSTNDTLAYLKTVLARSASEPARRDRVELLGAAFHWPNLGMVHGFDHAFGYNPLHIAEFTEATGAKDHMGESGKRDFTPLFPSFNSVFADLLGLRYIVSKLPAEQVDHHLKPGDLRLLARTRDGLIYENPRALPRAMFVGSWRLANFEDTLEKGFDPDFNPRAKVLLEKAPEDIAFATPDAHRDAHAQVRIISYANTEVVIEVVSERAGFVLLNDVWHPWWTATVNDEESEILKANVLFRAVQVEAGRSIVKFTFRPFDGMIAELQKRLLGEPADDTVSQIP